MIEEREVVRRMLTDENYLRKVVSHLKPEYFGDKTCEIIVSAVGDYFAEYAGKPTPLAVKTIIEGYKGDKSTDLEADASLRALDELKEPEEEPTDYKWFVDATEMFMRAKSVFNAIYESSEIIKAIQDGDEGQMMRLVPIVQDAVSVGFDYNEGKEIFKSADERHDFYTTSENKIPFDLDVLNEITNGGLSRKTLSVLMAETGVGKTMAMSSMAAANLRMGYNVLYFTLEISEFEILRRIDSNLLDVPILGLPSTEKMDFLTKLKGVYEESREARLKLMQGEIGRAKLYVKEYPPAGAGVPHFRRYVDELRVKKGFVPDVIYVDYINLCTSARVDAKASSYFVVKAITEELRALMVEQDCVGVTATQTNRSGYGNSDVNLSNTAECVDIDSTIHLASGKWKKIRDAEVGDVVVGRDGPRRIERVFGRKKKDCVEITTQGGRKIIASKDHKIWTPDGMKSVATGLSAGDEVLVET